MMNGCFVTTSRIINIYCNIIIIIYNYYVRLSCGELYARGRNACWEYYNIMLTSRSKVGAIQTAERFAECALSYFFPQIMNLFKYTFFELKSFTVNCLAVRCFEIVDVLEQIVSKCIYSG